MQLLLRWMTWCGRSGTTSLAARGIFAWNVAQHPESWNAHDSLAEALAANGDKAGALAEYRRSLELNPANENGRKMITKLVATP